MTVVPVPSSPPARPEPPEPAGVDPVHVLRQRWRLLALAAILGATAGVAYAALRPAHFEAEDVLVIGNVPSDPMTPGARSIQFQSTDEVIAMAMSPATSAAIGNGDPSAYSVDAAGVGAAAVRIKVIGSDEAGTAGFMDALLGRIEKEHGARYDQWQKNASAIQNRLEADANAGIKASLGPSSTDLLGQVFMSDRLAAGVAAARGSVYARRTERIGPASITRLPAHRARAAGAGALAAVAAGWLLAYLGALIRRP